jgi:hypothetical protein
MPGNDSSLGLQGPQKAQAQAQMVFHTVLTLLILVTAGNNHGHSTLRKGKEEVGYYDSLESETSVRPLRRDALNAITTLLVRNDEVVAATAHEPTVASAYKVVAVKDEDCPEDPPIDFTAVPNPERNLPVKDSLYDCQLSGPGSSYLEAVRENSWYCLKLE